jgi:hypothetical protein
MSAACAWPRRATCSRVYPVPAMLERIWVDDAGLAADEVRLRRQWYVVAAAADRSTRNARASG